MQTIDQRLWTWGQTEPERLAWRFHGEEGAVAWTFAEANRAISAVAQGLGGMGSPGAPALLLFPSGLEFLAGFFGSMRAGLVPVPAYPPDPSRLARSLPRLLAIAADCRPAVILTTRPLHELARRHADQAPQLARLPWLVVEEQPPSGGGEAAPRPADGLAFVQYTSGSTSRPKGVQITHGNIAAQMQLFAQTSGFGYHSRFGSWLPVYHDMGLVGKLLTPAWFGAQTDFMAPAAFLRRPASWLEMMSKARCTISASPDFGYALAAARCTAEEKAGLDLSAWEIAFNGAEPVRASTVRRFVQAFAASGFRPEAMTPCYGLAEATLQVSGPRKSAPARIIGVSAPSLRQQPPELRPGEQELVSSGPILDGLQVQILDPAGQPLPEGAVGEIGLQGPSISPGYLGQPPRQGALRTGDLGFLKDGELYVAGRLKDLIIIGGENFHPHDVEQALEGCHPRARPGRIAAFALRLGEGEGLGLLVEAEEADAGLVEALRRRASEALGLTIEGLGLLPLGALPKTSSGKLQRHRCAQAWLAGELPLLLREEQAAAGPPEEGQLLAWILAELRRCGAAGHPDQTFAAQGLDSRRGLELLSALEARLRRPLPVSTLYAHPTPRGLAAALSPGPAALRSPAEAPGGALGLRGISLRLPGARSLDELWGLLQEGRVAVGPPPPGRLGSGPAGWLSELEPLDPAVLGLSPAEVEAMDPHQRLLIQLCWEALADAGLSPGDLDGRRVGVYLGLSGPLGAPRALSEAPGPWTATGSSAAICANRISYLLNLRGPSLAVDTACSSGLSALHLAASALRAGEIELAIVGAANLLLEPRLTEALAAAGFLSDRCRTFEADGQGYVRAEGGVVLVVGAELEGARAQLLGSAQGQDGRSNGLTAPNPRAQQEVIRQAWAAAGLPLGGCFELHGTGTALGDPIETEALAELLPPGPQAVVSSIKANLGHTEAVAGLAGLCRLLLCLERAHLPPQVPVLRPSPRVPWARLRLPQGEPWTPAPCGLSAFSFGGSNVHVVLGPARGARRPLPPPELRPRRAPLAPARLDPEGQLRSILRQVIGVGDEELDETGSLVELGLDSMLALGLAARLERELGLPLRVDALLSCSSWRGLLRSAWGGEAAPHEHVVPRLMRSLEARPEQVVSEARRSWTGPELRAAALCLAAALERAGVGPGARVCLCLPRGGEGLIAMLAVAWLGAAWVALDPSWPPERRRRLAERAGAPWVIGEAVEGAARLSPYPGEELSPPPFRGGPDEAYVLYTSGSSGEPKGVIVDHLALSVHLSALGAALPLERPRWLSVTALSFDISIAELLLPLLHGGELYLVDEQTARDGRLLRRRVEELRPTWLQATPSTLRMLLHAGWAGDPDLRLISGGEALPLPLARALQQRCAQLWNAYGPTEATIWATLAEVREDAPIGLPLQGYRLRLEAGELWIGGPALARGYLNDPERTAERFVEREGQRWYRSGDAATLRADGQWEYGGRLDAQVKINGQRVEPGEVEAALEQLPGVRQAVVRPWKGSLVAFVVGAAEAAALEAGLRAQVPAHLLPARYVHLEELPRLSSGKIDRNALVPPAEAPASAAEGAVGLLVGLWSELLEQAAGPETDFFAAGGDSVLATALLLRVRESLGQDLPMHILAEAPTPAALLARLSEPTAQDLDLQAEAELEPTFQPGAWPTAPPRRLFMTGATGFLGRVVLAELARSTDWELRCLVRCSSPEEGQRRLGLPGVVAVPGDLCQPRLGLSPEEWERQAEEVDIILHNGALVNFVFPYPAMRAANVQGTRAALDLAAAGRPKHLHHVSTIAVFESEGYAEADEVGEEAELDRSTGLWDGYPQSKWVAERLVREAGRAGQMVSVHRPGMVTGPARPDLEDPRSLNEGDFIFRMIRGCARLGLAPDLDTLVELVPVDYVASAMVQLLRRGQPGTWHLTNPSPLRCRDFLAAISRLGYPMELLPWGEWRAEVLRRLSPDNPLFPLIPFFGTRRDPRSMRLPHFLTARTEAALGADGPRCPPVGEALLSRYIGWLEHRGLMPGRPRP